MGYYSGKYSTPELIWNTPIAPTALKFYNSEKIGNDYENDFLLQMPIPVVFIILISMKIGQVYNCKDH